MLVPKLTEPHSSSLILIKVALIVAAPMIVKVFLSVSLFFWATSNFNPWAYAAWHGDPFDPSDAQIGSKVRRRVNVLIYCRFF